jgi:Tfp pilus assembly protein PilN
MGSSFLPEDYLRQKHERRGNLISLALFCVVMFGVTGAFFVTNRQWSSVKARQREINLLYSQEAKKIEQLKVLEAQKTEMLAKAEITAALIERVPRSILLAELINRMPEQLTLTDLELDGQRIKEAPTVAARAARPKARSLAGKGGAKGKPEPEPEAPKPVAPKYDFKITLVGLAADDSFVADYQTALKDCPLLDNVDLLSTVAVKIDETVRRKFKIEATIRPSADARNIEPLKIPRNDPFGATAVGPDGKPAARPAGWTKRLGFTPGNAKAAEEPKPGEEPAPGVENTMVEDDKE